MTTIFDAHDAGAGPWYFSVEWAARLALARMGSEADAAWCIERVEADPPVRRVAYLLRDLAYTRSPLALRAIARYLDSEERLAMAGVKGCPYSQYAAYHLSGAIDGFPVRAYVGSFSEADIRRCREWIKAHGDWPDAIRR
jgi:hypothetical protein